MLHVFGVCVGFFRGKGVGGVAEGNKKIQINVKYCGKKNKKSQRVNMFMCRAAASLSELFNVACF